MRNVLIFGIGIFVLMVGSVSLQGKVETAPSKRDLSKGPGWGVPAPKWWQEAETYHMRYGTHTAEQMDRLVRLRAPLLIGGDHRKHDVEEFHKNGIKAIPYIDFTKAAELSKIKGAEGYHENRHAHISPYYQSINVDTHPEWVLIDEKGERKGMGPGWPWGCPQQASYRQAVVQGVRSLMDMGWDGVFVDEVFPGGNVTGLCYGPKFGVHKHDIDNYEEAYLNCLWDVWDIVKSYGEDKLIVLNDGASHDYMLKYQGYGDCLMWESFIYSLAPNPYDWHVVPVHAHALKDFLTRGKTVAALSYTATVGEKGDWVARPRDRAYYAYAWAKIAGYKWEWGDDDMFLIHLGKPQEDIFSIKDGVYYRVYQNGLVIVNPPGEKKTIQIPIPKRFVNLTELCEKKEAQVVDGVLRVEIPGEWGLVFVIKEGLLPERK